MSRIKFWEKKEPAKTEPMGVTIWDVDQKGKQDGILFEGYDLNDIATKIIPQVPKMPPNTVYMIEYSIRIEVLKPRVGE